MNGEMSTCVYIMRIERIGREIHAADNEAGKIHYLVLFGTQFEVQITGEAVEEEGITDIEVTILWVGPKGLQQQVFNTTVFDSPGEP